jgi:hypothetical protein
MIARRLALAVLLLAACGDDDHVADLASGADLQVADLPALEHDLAVCPAQFSGFPGVASSERRLDCNPCGCIIDPLTMAASQGLWEKTSTGATLSDSGAGLYIVTDGVSGPAFAALSSQSTLGPFYIDGDFDLRVDYLVSLPSNATHVLLRVDVGNGGTFYEVARRSASPTDSRYTAELAGLASMVSTTNDQGTLRLVRAGTTVTAYGDAMQAGQITSASTGRLGITLAAGVDTCIAPDGGSCTLVTTLKDVRLASGALVDRR